MSIFPDSEVLSVTRLHDGKMMTGSLRLAGLELMVLNGGPMYTHTEAFSLFVNCQTQEEVDELWEKLTADGGEPGRCGWLKDRHGLSWQIIPTALGELMGDPDPERANRVMQAMLEMDRIDIAGLQRAYDGA